MRPSPSADPHECVQNGRLPTFVTKPRNSLRRSHVQHRIPCLWYFQSAPLAKPETSCTIQVSRERHALEKTKKTGGNSSVGRVPDCDSGCRGFESHFPPQILESLQMQVCGDFSFVRFPLPSAFPSRFQGLSPRVAAKPRPSTLSPISASSALCYCSRSPQKPPQRGRLRSGARSRGRARRQTLNHSTL